MREEVAQLIQDLSDKRITIEPRGENLRLTPGSNVTPDLRNRIVLLKSELLMWLARAALTILKTHDVHLSLHGEVLCVDPPDDATYENYRTLIDRNEPSLVRVLDARRKARRKLSWGERFEMVRATEPYGGKRWWLLYGQYLKSREWETRSKETLRRERVCFHCNRSHSVQAHHLTYARVGRELPQDLRGVCVQCHDTITRRSRRMT